MKNKYKYKVMEVADELMAIPEGDCASQFRGVLKVNGVTADILRTLESDTSEEEIIVSLLKEYDADESTIRQNVHDVVEVLRKEGLLIE